MPPHTVISVGAGNTHGHPTQEALNRLAGKGVTIYRTDLNGSVVLTSDCNTYSISTTGTPPPPPQPTVPPTAPSGIDCSRDQYNCSDFSTCAEVMPVFNACPGDPNRLDGDNDGTPCESLCG